MKDLLFSLFGIYEPFVYETSETIYDTSGSAFSYTTSNIVSPDWPWILGVLGFFLILFCIFRFLYIVIGGRKR